ncbi:acetyltransferase (GNAT) family domain-containing protein [Cordyceps javanica]|uniref:Acetyltransferase (GNAT) family domain-containing protein n=1 Tax=Cordyceps javanica TaxID=43265 RepID=A0A545URD1_9HYPO|nr:acetyltransferase (GNAT) family domain-containing protein [Cordyceps javanica]TQW04181.1 acetyltransferase (GNAT) family domain-containing protein [Cordyceps javanica]
MIPTTTLRPRSPTTTSENDDTTTTFTLRPGRLRDVAAFARTYYAAFSDPRPSAAAAADNFLDVLFGPDYRDRRPDVEAALAAILAPRLWSLQYRLSALVVDKGTGDGNADADDDNVVGFVCVKRPESEVTFYERWLSPRLHALGTLLRRPRTVLDLRRAGAFPRAFALVEPRVRCSPRRRAAWYLSVVAVDPALQGRGLGVGMLRAALAHVEAAGARQPLRTPNDDGTDGADKGRENEEEEPAAAAAAAAEENGKEKDQQVEEMGGPAVWLTARKGTEGLYRKLGFVKVMDSNTGPLSAWNGGAVMFRGLHGVTDRP